MSKTNLNAKLLIISSQPSKLCKFKTTYYPTADWRIVYIAANVADKKGEAVLGGSRQMN